MRWNFADELVPMHSKTHAPPTPNPPPRRPPCRTRTHCPVSRWPIFCIEVIYDKLSCSKQYLKAHVVGMRRGAKGFEFDDFLWACRPPHSFVLLLQSCPISSSCRPQPHCHHLRRCACSSPAFSSSSRARSFFASDALGCPERPDPRGGDEASRSRARTIIRGFYSDNAKISRGSLLSWSTRPTTGQSIRLSPTCIHNELGIELAVSQSAFF